MQQTMTRRFAAQLLSGRPARDPVAVAERILAIQAQDLRGARLAIRARTKGANTADIDRALDDRSLVITWLNRGTLHLTRTEDYFWLHALTTPPLFAGNARRLSQEGVSPREADRGVAIVQRALAHGPLTRKELREKLAARKVRVEGQALVHILMLASLRGITVRGPMVGREQAYVLVREWIGAPPRFDRDVALAELARRYVAGHGPANERDLVKWSGLPLRDSRAGFNSIAKELVERSGGLFESKGRRPSSAMPPPRLLGPYEPVLLGWTSRKEIVGAAHPLVTANGLFRPFALVGGRAVATWTMSGSKLVLSPFGRIARDVERALDADAKDVRRFFSET